MATSESDDDVFGDETEDLAGHEELPRGSERDLIEYYFYWGLTYRDMTLMLERHHNVAISERTLKRRLKDCGLSRREGVDDDLKERVRDIILREVCTGPESLSGYRTMWHVRGTTSMFLGVWLSRFSERLIQGEWSRGSTDASNAERTSHPGRISAGTSMAMTNWSHSAFPFMAVQMASAEEFCGSRCSVPTKIHDWWRAISCNMLKLHEDAPRVYTLILALKMESLPGCNATCELTARMNTLGTRPTSTCPAHEING